MTRQEIRQIIWDELGKNLDVFLTSIASGADGQGNEGYGSILPGTPTIAETPVAFPYGFNARTPNGTSQLVARLGNSPLNRIVTGHFDPSRPALNQGETCLYNAFGQQIRIQNGKILIGNSASSHPYVLGDIMVTFLNSLMDALIQHTHAAPGAPPTNLATFEELQSNYVADGNESEVLSQLIMGT